MRQQPPNAPVALAIAISAAAGGFMRNVKELLLLLPLAACYVLISRLNPTLAPQLPSLLFFMVGFVVLPAIGLGRLLVRLPLTPAEGLALGSPAAMALLFGLAYATAAFHLPGLIWAQPAIGGVACLVAWVRARRKAVGQTPTQMPLGDLLLTGAGLAAGLALCVPDIVATSVPGPGVALNYYIDDVGHASYVFAALRAMEHGLPVWDPLVAGTTLSYHLLFHFCYAACFQVTGAHPLDQVMLLWPPALWLLLVGAIVTGCRKLAGFTLLETAIVLVLTIFSSGWGFNSTPAVQLFSYQHTFFMSLPAVFLFVTALYGYLTGRRTRLLAVHTAVSFLVCSATKAILMPVLPLALLPVLVLRFVRRQVRRPELVLVGLCLTAAVALKLSLYRDTARAVLQLPALGKLLMGVLSCLGEVGLALGAYFAFTAFAADANPVLRRKLDRDGQYYLFCLTYVLVSVVLLKTFNFIGGGFYFYWYARVLVLLAFAPVAAHVFTWRTPKFAPALIVLLLLGLGMTVWSMFFFTQTKGLPEDMSAKVLDQDERDGLRWAAAHLDRRKSFFTNKDSYLSSYLGTYIHSDMYDYLGLSGLQGYAWSTSWLSEPALSMARGRAQGQRAFFEAATPEARAAVLAELDVDYYFQCVRLTPPGFVVPPCLREVHRTPSLVIYENTCRAHGPDAAHANKELAS
jgi:hypothetical protein